MSGDVYIGPIQHSESAVECRCADCERKRTDHAAPVTNTHQHRWTFAALIPPTLNEAMQGGKSTVLLTCDCGEMWRRPITVADHD